MCQSGTGKDIELQRAVLWPIDHSGFRESHWTNKGRLCSGVTGL